jgi:DNA-binding MarR family transcriptional regulator
MRNASGVRRSASGATRQMAEHESLRVWLRLLSCSTLVEREVRARLRGEFDVTLPQFDLLAQLDAAERDDVRGLTMSELSRRLMVTNGNLTGLVERMLHEGLVRRAASPTDGRSQLVRLSAQGRRAFAAMAPRHEAWIEELFGALPQAQREQLYDTLGQLRDAIRTSLSAGAAS